MMYKLGDKIMRGKIKATIYKITGTKCFYCHSKGIGWFNRKD